MMIYYNSLQAEKQVIFFSYVATLHSYRDIILYVYTSYQSNDLYKNLFQYYYYYYYFILISHITRSSFFFLTSTS